MTPVNPIFRLSLMALFTLDLAFISNILSALRSIAVKAGIKSVNPSISI